jgi:hypothetical protein
MYKAAGATVDCVSEVIYYSIETGRCAGATFCYLGLVGKDGPLNLPACWPAIRFRLVWNGDKANH